MLDFKPLHPQDAQILRPYLTGEGRICDNTPGTAVMWRGSFNTHYAVRNDTAVLRMYHSQGGETYSYPSGNAPEELLEEIISDTRKRGVTPRFCSMSRGLAEALCARCGGEPTASRRWADYLYPAENFISYSGRKLHEKRNHVNRFLAEHSDWEYVPIDSSSLPRAREFYSDYMERNVKDSPIARHEAKICLEVLDRWSDYGFSGGMLIAGGAIVGITAGEAIGDTLYVHIEKAERTVNGAYQMLASCFVRSFGDKVAFVNREDDSGDAGLRQSKLSLCPCELLYKYTLEIAGG